jgi:hypothetical protein
MVYEAHNIGLDVIKGLMKCLDVPGNGGAQFRIGIGCERLWGYFI